MMEVDGLEVVFQDPIVSGVRQGEMAEVAHVGLRPVGFPDVVVSKSAEHGEEATLGPAEVIDGIGAGSAQKFQSLNRAWRQRCRGC